MKHFQRNGVRNIPSLLYYTMFLFLFFFWKTTVPTFFSEFTTLNFGLNRRENVQVGYDFILANAKEVLTQLELGRMLHFDVFSNLLGQFSVLLT